MVEADASETREVPAWVMTFADLMTLLMCFFVLLLAFSEMDAAKFKLLSGSMKEAFGVQADIEARTIPKGTSIIAQEFSPGNPDPTAINQIRQYTVDSNRNSLDALSEESDIVKSAKRQEARIRQALRDQIDKGTVAVQLKGHDVIIRILEQASFSSGKADVRASFMPVLRRIAGLIASGSGTVTVSGHTDNVPISTWQFRSNWELSTARAVSVAHELLNAAPLDPMRLVVAGHADTRPQSGNDTVENRAKNRRVDISISHGVSDEDGSEEFSVASTGPSRESES